MLSSIVIPLNVDARRIKYQLTTSSHIGLQIASFRCQGSRSGNQNQLRMELCEIRRHESRALVLTFTNYVQGCAREPRGHVDDRLTCGV